MWFDRIAGAVVLVLGMALVVPGGFLLIAPLFGFYTVGLTPHWLAHALYGIAVLGIVQAIGGVNMIRWAGRWE